MSSFVETKGLEQLTKSPVEFVEYPWTCAELTLMKSCAIGLIFVFYKEKLHEMAKVCHLGVINSFRFHMQWWEG